MRECGSCRERTKHYTENWRSVIYTEPLSFNAMSYVASSWHGTFFSEGIRKNTEESLNLWEMSCWKKSLGTLYMVQLDNNKQSRDLGDSWYDMSSIFTCCDGSLATAPKKLQASPIEHKAQRLHLITIETCRALLNLLCYGLLMFPALHSFRLSRDLFSLWN